METPVDRAYERYDRSIKRDCTELNLVRSRYNIDNFLSAPLFMRLHRHQGRTRTVKYTPLYTVYTVIVKFTTSHRYQPLRQNFLFPLLFAWIIFYEWIYIYMYMDERVLIFFSNHLLLHLYCKKMSWKWRGIFSVQINI